jgi:hypothetical protein
VEYLLVEVVDVFGTKDLTVLVTVCVIDWTGLVVCVVVDGFGAGAVVGVVVGAGAVVGVVVGAGAVGAVVGVVVGDVAAPAGTKPATDPAASITPDVTTPAATKRRFRLIFIRSFSV